MQKVISCGSSEWNKYIDKLPEKLRDIYFSNEYYTLCEKNGDGQGRLWVYEDEGNLAVYPFLLNEIKCFKGYESYYDIETAYGYGGPLVSYRDGECTEECRSKFKNDSQYIRENEAMDNLKSNPFNNSVSKFCRAFECAFEEYCQDNNIVAEFIRFHPLMKNETIFKDNISVEYSRHTVYIDLAKSLDDIWSEDIISKNRNMIRKALKYNLTVNFNDDIDTFKKIYQKTMTKVKAAKYYYFSEQYYDCLKKMDKVIINIDYQDITIASGVFLKYGNYFHYHLSGSLKEYLRYAPNNLMLWSAVKYAKDNNFKIMHFGGGLSGDLNDRLFCFKKSFSSKMADFYIGRRIHNKKVYDELIDLWEKKNKRKSVLFLQYKY